MQRIISLFAALMILFFSIIGEEAHASASICADSSVIQQHHSDASRAPARAAIVKEVAASSDVTPTLHDCHFGHCAFILLLSSMVSTPAPFTAAEIAKLYPYLQSGFRSETLRPPSLA